MTRWLWLGVLWGWVGLGSTETVLKTLPCPGPDQGYYAWGLTFVNGHLYVADDLLGWVYVVDTTDGTVLDSFPGPNDSNHGLAFDGTYLWYASYRWTSPYIYKLTLDGQKVDSIHALDFAAGDYIGGLTWDGQYLWVSIYYPNDPLNLYRVDVTTHQAVDTLPAQGTQPHGLAWDGQALWNVMDDNDGDPERVWKLDPQTGDTLLSFPVPTTRPRDLTWDGEALWLIAETENGPGMTLYRIDPYGTGYPEIFLPLTQYDFGNVPVGDSSTWNLPVYNQGSAPLIIDSLPTTNPAFHAGTSFPVTIDPASAGEIPIVFVPLATGPDQATLTVYSNDPVQPVIPIGVQGTGVLQGPEIELPDTLHDYGSVRARALTRWWLPVVNIGSDPLILDSAIVDIPVIDCQGTFYIEPYEFPITVWPMDTARIPVWFWAPDSGLAEAALGIFSNDPDEPVRWVYLEGSGDPTPVPEGGLFWLHVVQGDIWEHIRSLKTLQDLNGDSVPEVLAVSENDTLYCLNGNAYLTGDVLWKFPTSPPYVERGMIVIPDVDGDGVQDIALATVWGGRQVRVISGKTGTLIWQYDTHEYGEGGWVYEVAEFVDLTGDGIPEILAGAGDDSYGTGPKRGYCFNGATGAKIWEAPAGYAVLGIRAIGDVNGDGIPEVAMATADGSPSSYNVILVDGATGTQIWQQSLASYGAGWTVVPVGDVNDDGIPDLAAGTYGYVVVLSGSNGAILHALNVGSIVVELVPMEDMNGDGTPELLPAGTVPALYNIDPRAGTFNWVATMPDMVFSVAPLADLSGDGVPEIAVGTGYTTNRLMVVSGADGSEIWSNPMSGPVEVVYGISSIDGNATMDVLAGTRNGMIAAYSNGEGYAVSEGAPRKAPVRWRVWPTVTTRWVWLQWTPPGPGSYLLQVFDVTGRRVMTRIWDPGTHGGSRWLLDLQPLKAGVYVIHLKVGPSKTLKAKVLKLGNSDR